MQAGSSKSSVGRGDGFPRHEETAAALGGEVREPVTTAPHNCKVLRAGVDSLYLSYPGKLTVDAYARLLEAKQKAQSSEDQIQAEAYASVLDHRFAVGAGGLRFYPFILTDGCYRIQLSSLKASRIPLAYCQIKSAFLTTVGPEQAVSQLRQVVSAFGQIDEAPKVSRIDLFVDFTADTVLDGWREAAWVKRGREARQHWDNNRCTGWSIGQGGVITGVLYDKTIEIKKSGKDYLLPLWQEAGWQPGQSVYRLEFRFKIEFLKQLGFTGYDQVMLNRGALWAYACNEWLRLSIPNESDDTKSRWPTHPLWEALAAVDWGVPPSPPLQRVVVPAAAPGDEMLFGYYLGALTSFMAKYGYSSPLEAGPDFYIKTREHFDAVLYTTGRTFNDLARDRAARKATQWNLKFPGVDEKVEAERLAQEAAAYRKTSGR